RPIEEVRQSMTRTSAAVRQFRASSFRAVSMVSAPLVALPLLATGTAHAAPIVTAVTVPPPPTPSVTLPADIDVAPSYQQQTTCDPTAKPGVIDFAKLLNQHYGTRYYGIGRNCNS